MKHDDCDSAKYVLSRVDSYFSLASVKAAVLLPANALLIGVTLAGLFQLSAGALLNLPVRLAITVTLLAALVSTTLALWVTAAFLQGGSRTGDYASVVFFGSVMGFERETYCREFVETAGPDFTRDLLEQVHLLSKALHDKYVVLNWSLGFCAVGYISVVVAGLVVCWGV